MRGACVRRPRSRPALDAVPGEPIPLPHPYAPVLVPGLGSLQSRANAEFPDPGGEATYLPLSWLGVSERFDHVRLHGSDSKQAFTIYSSRLLFHLGWKSRAEFALQYSHFVYGSRVPVTSSYDPALAVAVNPDHDVFSLIGTYWW